jgi:hypothetical protein
MPRYYFHFRDSVETLDHEGVELVGIEQARALAVTSSGEMIRDLGERFWRHPEWEAWVTDEKGETVCSLRFAGNPVPS